MRESTRVRPRKTAKTWGSTDSVAKVRMRMGGREAAGPASLRSAGSARPRLRQPQPLPPPAPWPAVGPPRGPRQAVQSRRAPRLATRPRSTAAWTHPACSSVLGRPSAWQPPSVAFCMAAPLLGRPGCSRSSPSCWRRIQSAGSPGHGRCCQSAISLSSARSKKKTCQSG